MFNKISSFIKVSVFSTIAIFAIIGCQSLNSVDHSSKQTIETQRIANRFLRALFVDNKFSEAYVLYADPNFIQHNPYMADGIAGRDEYFSRRAAQSGNGNTGLWANVIDRVVVDGDLFAVQHHAFLNAQDKGRNFVDIWRVENGKIIEHWDVVEAVDEGSLPHNNSLWCNVGNSYEEARAIKDSLANPACGKVDETAKREETLRVFTSYVTQLSSGDVRAAITNWFHPNYKQHSANIGDGAGAAIEFLEKYFDNSSPKPKSGTARLLAQGDIVLVERYEEPFGNSHGKISADIFKIKDGKIYEHWDFSQDLPQIRANNNSPY